MARSRVRRRLVRKKGGRHGVRKGAKKRVMKKSKAVKKQQAESAPTKRKPRPPRNGSAKTSSKKRRSSYQRNPQQERDRLDTMNDDELARELGLGKDANEAVANANRDEEPETPEDGIEATMEEVGLIEEVDLEEEMPPHMGRSHPGDRDGSS